MKKLLLLSAFVIGSFAAKAQATTAIYKQTPALSPLTIRFGGNTYAPGVCAPGTIYLTSLYTATPFYTTLNAASTPVTPPGVVCNNFTVLYFESLLGGGGSIDLCGLPPSGTFTYSVFVGGVTVWVDVNVAGSVYTFDFY